jgi:hypothetical protein
MKRLARIAAVILAGWPAALAAAEHRPEVREDWAFQHRYAVSADKAGKLGLHSERQSVPLVNVGHMLTRTTTGHFNGLGATEPGGSLWVIRDWKGPGQELVDVYKGAKVENGPSKGRILAGGMFHAPPDTRTTPDRFGARRSRIWEFVQENKDRLQGLQKDDLRLFALWLDLLCVDYSYSARNSVKDASGYAWPRHPDLDVNNPLGLEVVPGKLRGTEQARKDGGQ